MAIYPRQFCLFAGSFIAPEDETYCIDEAKKYVKKNGFTSDDVRIVKSDGAILVVTKREVELKEDQDET